MNEDNKLEYLKSMNERVYEQLSYAETKNGILLGLLTAIIGVLVSTLVGDIDIPCGLKIYLAILTATFSISLISCLLSFFPNLKVLKNSPNPNLYFYGDLAKFDTTDAYDDNIEKTQDRIMHLEAQNIHVSKIIMRKHRFFTIAIHCIFAGLVLPLYLGFIIWSYIEKHKNSKV